MIVERPVDKVSVDQAFSTRRHSLLLHKLEHRESTVNKHARAYYNCTADYVTRTQQWGGGKAPFQLCSHASPERVRWLSIMIVSPLLSRSLSIYLVAAAATATTSAMTK